MVEVSKIVMQAGLVGSSVVTEFARWGSLMEVPEPVQFDPKDVPSAIEQAIQNQDCMVRETDLELLQLFLRTQRAGLIHMEPMGGEAVEFQISYGLDRLGQFIIPWTEAENITEHLTNGATYLMHEGRKTFMKDARELFYGTKKAFIVCTPDSHERG